MPLDLAALRLLAWQGPFDPCTTCGQTVGHRCRTTSGALTTPHVSRMDWARGYDARQPEVDALNALVVSLRASNDQLVALDATKDDKLDMAMQRITNLQGDVADRDATIAAAQTALAHETAEYDKVNAKAGQLADRLAAAQQELADYKASHPDEPVPPAQTTRFGMNVSQGTSFTQAASENAATIVKRLVSTYGALPTSKVFYSGALPATFNTAYEGQVPGKHAYVCFKSFSVANLNSYCASIPAGWTVTLIYFQEPDDEIWVDKSMTIAAYTAATKQVLDTVKASAAGKDGRARVGSCFMEYSLTSGRWSDSVVVPGIDCLAFDAYFNTSPPADPSTRIKAMRAVADRLGIGAWAVLEMGDRPTTFKSGDDRAAFWAKVYASLAAEGAESVVYFNAVGTTGDHRIIPGQPYSDPMVALLKTRMSA